MCCQDVLFAGCGEKCRDGAAAPSRGAPALRGELGAEV